MLPAPVPRHILVTGASSGIGEALALALAAPGVRLSLGGRDPQRLQAVVIACRQRGAEADGRVLDVCDRVAMRHWLCEADNQAPLQLVIANAGISGGTSGSLQGEDEDQSRRIFHTNLDGVLNTVLPAIDLMRPRHQGQIAIMASLASWRGMPTAPAYCASKAAVRVWGESLRGMLAPSGISVSVILPGFVKSRITDANGFAMPFLMDADTAARIILHGLHRRRGRIAFPWPLVVASWLLAALPDRLAGFITRRFPAKGD